MKILVLSWRDPKHPLAGGAEAVMHEHMKGWVKAGHDVTLFSSKTKGLKRQETIDKVKIVRRGPEYLGVQVAAFFYYLKTKEKIDLVVDQFHGIPFFTPLYVRGSKLAVTQEIARNVWMLNKLPFPLNFLIGAVGLIGEPFIYRFIYKRIVFMTGSESAKKDIARFGIPKENITVVGHGVITLKEEVKKSRPSLPLRGKEKVKTVIYLGILSKDKGVEDAIEVFSILDKKGKYNFWLVGKPETRAYLERLEKKTKEAKFLNGVIFWGHVSQKKKFELLSRSHVLINPSVHEGWGLVNIEANSVGTPVVAYASAGLVDSVKEGRSGLLTKEKTPKALAQRVTTLLESKGLYKSLSEGALLWSKSFSWGRAVKASLRLIESLTSS